MKKNIAKMLSNQVNMELFSAYLYLEFNNWLMDQGLTSFAHWYRVQAMEERDHAMLIYDYLHHNNETVDLAAIEQPTTDAKGVMDILKAGLEHEELITNSINDIYEAALKEKDYRTKEFLDWFVKEQGEEEKSADNLVEKFKLFGTDAKSLYMLDNELAGRVYAPPSLVL